MAKFIWWWTEIPATTDTQERGHTRKRQEGGEEGMGQGSTSMHVQRSTCTLEDWFLGTAVNEWIYLHMGQYEVLLGRVKENIQNIGWYSLHSYTVQGFVAPLVFFLSSSSAAEEYLFNSIGNFTGVLLHWLLNRHVVAHSLENQLVQYSFISTRWLHPCKIMLWERMKDLYSF